MISKTRPGLVQGRLPELKALTSHWIEHAKAAKGVVVSINSVLVTLRGTKAIILQQKLCPPSWYIELPSYTNE